MFATGTLETMLGPTHREAFEQQAGSIRLALPAASVTMPP